MHDIRYPSLLFEALSDAFYFAKDRDGRFTYANQLLLKHFGMKSKNEIIGKTDFDILGAEAGQKWQAIDREIMESGKAVVNQIELVGDGRGKVRWFQTTKVALYNSNGEIIGIEGITRDMSLSRDAIEPYSEFKCVIETIQKDFKKNISITDLAREAAMSMSTFERKFKKHFGCTAKMYLKNYRLEEACRLLRAGYSISETALNCGFCDQSYFSKEFRKVMGVTPRTYVKNASKLSQNI